MFTILRFNVSDIISVFILNHVLISDSSFWSRVQLGLGNILDKSKSRVRITSESGRKWVRVQGLGVRVQNTLACPYPSESLKSSGRSLKTWLSPLTSIDVTMYRVCPLYLLIIEFHFVQKVSNLIHVETHFID